MNERAAAALVEAAMSGVRQIRGSLLDDDHGRCAGAVIIEAAVGTKRLIEERYGRDWDEVLRWADMTTGEWVAMVGKNNLEGWDFLAISRKLGPSEIPA
jgi:hypothetical protein